MSKDYKKFTIIFGGIDYVVFEICDEPKECKILLEHENSPDCNFAENEDKPGETYIVCNLNK